MTGLSTPLVAGSGLDDTFAGIKVRASRIVWGADGARVCLIDDAGGATPDMRDAIIRAVNAHDGLVAALQRIVALAGEHADGAPDSTPAAKDCAAIEWIAREALRGL
jgi:hypothetical protein